MQATRPEGYPEIPRNGGYQSWGTPPAATPQNFPQGDYMGYPGSVAPTAVPPGAPFAATPPVPFGAAQGVAPALNDETRRKLSPLYNYDVKFVLENSKYTTSETMAARFALDTLVPLVSQYDRDGMEACLAGANGPSNLTTFADTRNVPQFLSNLTGGAQVRLTPTLDSIVADYRKQIIAGCGSAPRKGVAVVFLTSGKLADEDKFIESLTKIKHDLRTGGIDPRSISVGMMLLGDSGQGQRLLRRIDDDRSIGKMVESNVDYKRGMQNRAVDLLVGMMDAQSDKKNDGFFHGWGAKKR